MVIKASELLKTSAVHLKEAGIHDWEYDSRVLLEWVCGISRIDLILDPGLTVDEEKAALYCEYIERRKSHEPLQYLIGEWEFMGLPFYVNPSVLIPRQDTEVLVEWILDQEENCCKKEEEFAILDVCTGSGCIGISLDVLLKERSKKNIRVDALDFSQKALETAVKNNQRNESDVRFIESDMFDKVTDRYDIIVSNPPYIPTKVVDGLMAEVVRHEPRLALDGMEDGLYFYRILAEQAGSYLKPGGRLYLEIGHDQGYSVPELLRDAGFTSVEVRKDLAGLDRCVRAEFGK